MLGTRLLIFQRILVQLPFHPSLPSLFLSSFLPSFRLPFSPFSSFFLLFFSKKYTHYTVFTFFLLLLIQVKAQHFWFFGSSLKTLVLVFYCVSQITVSSVQVLACPSSEKNGCIFWRNTYGANYNPMAIGGNRVSQRRCWRCINIHSVCLRTAARSLLRHQEQKNIWHKPSPPEFLSLQVVENVSFLHIYLVLLSIFLGKGSVFFLH